MNDQLSVSREIINSIYGKQAGKYVECQLDEDGNPVKEKVIMGENEEFKNEKLIIGCFHHENNLISDLQEIIIPILKNKGLKFYRISYTEQEFIENLKDYDQAGIISYREFKQKDYEKQFVDAVLKFHYSGKGIILWTDNDPYYKHANMILEQLSFGKYNNDDIKIQISGTVNLLIQDTKKKIIFQDFLCLKLEVSQIRMENQYKKITFEKNLYLKLEVSQIRKTLNQKVNGNYIGKNKISVNLLDFQKQSGNFKYHLITHGINNLYEGVTISYPKIVSNTPKDQFGDLNIIGMNSNTKDPQPVLFVYEGNLERGRIIFDCGFTKLFKEFFYTAATDTYISNIYLYAYQLERFTESD